jgi:hypothetical protein
MQESVAAWIIIDSHKITTENVKRWFSENPFFAPTQMNCKYLTKGKSRKFSQDPFFESICKEVDSDRVSITVLNDQNDCSLIKGSYTEDIAWFTYRLSPEMFEANKDNLFKYIDDFMKKYDGIVAKVCSLEDYFWQENENLLFYTSKGKSLDGVHTKQSPLFPNDKIVDTEYNPGHSHIVNGIWFGSCWAMWFGKKFFTYIPKEVLKKYHGCYENIEICDDLIRIRLHEKIWAYDEPNNRKRQFEFRRQVGMDEVAHSLLKQPQKASDNPAIQFESGNFGHGGVRLITYYYNKEGEVVEKSKSVKSKTYELDEKGKTVWEDNRITN